MALFNCQFLSSDCGLKIVITKENNFMYEEAGHDTADYFNGDDEDQKLSAAKAWSKWEASTSYINYNPEAVKDSVNSNFALAFALIENHYFVNKGFLDYEEQLLDNVDKVRHIPTIIVQGRYDVVCPPTTAYELHSRWPESELKIAPFSGHSAFEKEITHLLIEATNKFSMNK